MKNVLLLCMSPLSSNPNKSTYGFIGSNGKTKTVDGIMTNEAPTKAVIEILEGRNGGNHLDKVVMICSEKVHNKIESIDKLDLSKIEELGLNEYLDASHITLYQKLIDNYAKKANACYEKQPIEYEIVKIPDYTVDKEVSESAIEAAKKVAETGEKINLFIDFNGGQRYVAFMILAIANLMKLRHIDIDQIMTMNFDNKLDGNVQIQNMEPVFTIFDFISGINEYVNYGRIKTLKSYFSKTSDKKIKEILRKMEEFSNNLQLCRTGYIMEHRGELYELLKNYSEQNKEAEKLDTYEQLFTYVVDDITRGCEGLLTGELPAVIKWCVDNEFIQQALTFTSEEMPGYFWKSGIFKASSEEQREYDYFLEKLRAKRTSNKSKKKYSGLKNSYRKEHKSDSSKYAYEWMINYLSFSCVDKDYQLLLQDENSEFKQLVFWGPEDNIIMGNAKRGWKFEKINLHGIDRKKLLPSTKKNAAKLSWHIENDSRRVFSNIEDKELLKEVLRLYFLLKEQRNSTNHADGEKDEKDQLTYEQLCTALNALCNAIEKRVE